MRTITTTVFGYDELSEDAKESAYDNWHTNVMQHSYAWGSENAAILDAIKEATGVEVNDWRYDTCNYRYSLCDIEPITHPEGYHAFDSNMDELVGVRAAKVALAIYYQLTEQRIVYGFNAHTNKKVKSTTQYMSHIGKMRRSSFMEVDRCFTGYCFSETFSSELWNSIAKNGHSDAYSVGDHLKAAFDKLFQDFVDDAAHAETREHFEDCDAYEVEYFEDGEVCHIHEDAA